MNQSWNAYWMLICCLLFCSGTLYAQSARQYLNQGDKAFERANYYQAASYYQVAYEKNFKNKEIAFKLAEASRLFNDYDQAYRFYEDALRTFRYENPNTVLAEFWMGEMAMRRATYDEAYFHFENFVKQYSKEGYYRLKAEQQMKACKWAMKESRQEIQVEIKHLGDDINTFFTEFSLSALDENSWQFSSVRTNIGTKMKPNYVSRIYKFDEDADGFPVIDSSFLAGVQQTEKHVGNGSLSEDGQHFFFTLCENKNFSELRCDIYQLKKQNNCWCGEPLRLSINEDSFTSTQPYFTGKDLYFASDRPEGYGKLDLYKSVYQDGKFLQPENLGPEINSADEEVSPFYDSREQKLYFSSTWHLGLGGFDIFFSSKEAGKWTEPENLGRDFNTSYNDYYFNKDYKNKKAYLTSNRSGSLFIKGEGCCNDLYEADIQFIPEREPEIEIEDTLEIVSIDTPQIPDTPVAVVAEQSDFVLPKEPELPAKPYERYFENFEPLSLYFDNDHPNPRTNSDTTKIDYKTTYEAYSNRRVLYQNEYAKGLNEAEQKIAKEQITTLFNEYVDEGFYKLISFIGNLRRALEDGRKTKITLKGYCSPLAVNDYNINLSYRRIACLRNFILSYRDGYFMDFLEQGQLIIDKEPYGEEFANERISDDRLNVQESVYSPDAALERRVEILSAEIE